MPLKSLKTCWVSKYILLCYRKMSLYQICLCQMSAYIKKYWIILTISIIKNKRKNNSLLISISFMYRLSMNVLLMSLTSISPLEDKQITPPHCRICFYLLKSFQKVNGLLNQKLVILNLNLLKPSPELK